MRVQMKQNFIFFNFLSISIMKDLLIFAGEMNCVIKTWAINFPMWTSDRKLLLFLIWMIAIYTCTVHVSQPVQ